MQVKHLLHKLLNIKAIQLVINGLALFSVFTRITASDSIFLKLREIISVWSLFGILSPVSDAIPHVVSPLLASVIVDVDVVECQQVDHQRWGGVGA